MKKKGISLVILIVTITVIIILSSVVTITGYNAINNSNKFKFASEILYVESMVDSYRENNNGKYPSSYLVYIDMSKIEAKDVDKQFKNEDIKDNTLILNKIDFSLLNPSKLIYGMSNEPESDDIYAISSTTGKVYYVKGAKIGTNNYYTLTDKLKDQIGYTSNNINDGIIFTSDYSLENRGKLYIKVPSNYLDVLVISTDDGFSYTTQNEDSYVVYTVNSNINSVITLKYKISDDGNVKSIKYNICDLDKQAPDFDISSIQTLKKQDTDKEENYVYISNVSDNLSGVKYIKYSNGHVDKNNAKEYFKHSGITVNDNIINIEKDLEYSIYIEDNSGNFDIKYIN